MTESDNTQNKMQDLDDLQNQCEATESVDSEMEQVIEQLRQMPQDEIIELVLNQQKAYIDNQAKITELTTLAKRVQADFDNYRKRNAENVARVRQEASADVVERFLPTLDIIDQAMLMIKDVQVFDGIKMMRKQLMDVFGAYGVVEIDATDAVFDPNLHEAVMSEDNVEKSGRVLEVFRKGYRMGDKVLRYAAVKVAN